MFDLNPLTAISREVREWMAALDTRKTVKNQSVRQAIESLSNAVLKTRAYFADLSASTFSDFAKESSRISSHMAKRNLAAEQELSQLWNAAHLSLRAIDPALADRCFAKAEYWTDPSSWPDEKIRQYNIQLESMSEAVRDFQSK
jgi:hypothetical protein